MNPYVAGNSVGGSDAFIGRSDILYSVVRVLQNSSENAIVLHGQRRIGKTSVLHELEKRLPQEGPYRPLYFDLQDKASVPLAKVIYELAQQLAEQFGLAPLKAEVDDVPDTFRKQFLPDLLAHLPDDASLVILFDEFDVLDQRERAQAGQDFFPYLRKLLTLDARLQFVFVIGRRPEDLTISLSMFKGVKFELVSLLSPEDTKKLIRLSERSGSLLWADDAVMRVRELTGGHPFLTQQLCQEIWHNVVEQDKVSTVLIQHVDAAVEATLRGATNTLEWLWDGLGPAERMVAAALAAAGGHAISQKELESRLRSSGVHILIGELEMAPETLKKWDLIEPVPNGYLFRVELLRRWIAENKSIARVKVELDHVFIAEKLYEVAFANFQNGRYELAAEHAREITQSNPNHIRGSLLLIDALLVQHKAAEASELFELLERFYKQQPSIVRPRLIQALLEQARVEEKEDKRLEFYERVLELDPTHAEAETGQQHVLIAKLEKEGRFTEARDLSQKLLDALPSGHPQRTTLEQRIEQLGHKTQLESLYQRGVNALQQNNRIAAINLLKEVVTVEPNYQEVTRYLYQAVTETDIEQLKSELMAKQAVQDKLVEELKQSQQKWKDEEIARRSIQDSLVQEAKKQEELTKKVLHLQRQLNIDEKRSLWFRFLHQPPTWFTWGLGIALIVVILYVARDGLTRQLQPVVQTASEQFQTASAQLQTWMATSTPLPIDKWGTQPPTAPIAGTTWLDSQYEITFTYVPSGIFIMGSTQQQIDSALDECKQFKADCERFWYADEYPQYKTTLSTFWIMNTEVTNKQYRKCVQASICSLPSNSTWNSPDQADYPVTNVTWKQARIFANWIGGRLPTEAEWEKTARGTDGRIYPWGNEWQGNYLNYCDQSCTNEWKDNSIKDNFVQTAPVGSYPAGISPYGALDMAGNVWEWVADKYDKDYYAVKPDNDPLGPNSGENYVLRGGSWDDLSSNTRASDRFGLKADAYTGYIGFRVARDTILLK